MTFPMSRGLLRVVFHPRDASREAQVEMTFPMSRGLLRKRERPADPELDCGNDLPDE